MIACPTGPVNAGTFEVVELVVPEGSILNPIHGAPVRMRAATGQLVPVLVFGALAQGSNRAVMAESAASAVDPAFAASAPDGRRIAEMTMCSGGTGASTRIRTGETHIRFPPTLGNSPIEVLSARAATDVRRTGNIAWDRRRR